MSKTISGVTTVDGGRTGGGDSSFTAITYDQEEGERTPELPDPPYIPHRVFVNQFDNYEGEYITKYIASQQVGGNAAEGEEEEEEANPFELNLMGQPKVMYQVLSTGIERTCTKPDHIFHMIDKDQDDYMDQILKCGFVVFDITWDRDQIEEAARVLAAMDQLVQQMKEANPKLLEESNETRFFILVSTILTWANTKPISKKNPTLPFKESDYRKRRAHINCRPHIELEKEVVLVGRKHKQLLRTAVIGAGITYGGGEEALEHLFRMAWKNVDSLPIMFPGTNNLPLIHVQDLAQCVFHLIADIPKKKQYFLAVEPVGTKLQNIVRVVSTNIGSGKVTMVPKEHFFYFPAELTQLVFDKVSLNLYMEPTTFADTQWQNEMGFTAMGRTLTDEYLLARGLAPVRICILGPPASGKSVLAKMFADFYNLHHLKIAELIRDGIQTLKNNIASNLEEKAEKAAMKGQGGDEDMMEGEGDEPQDRLKEWQDLLQEITENMAANPDGRLDDSYVIKLYKDRILSSPCQNQGYVLDGWPKDFKQAQIVFGVAQQEGGEGGGGGGGEGGAEDEGVLFNVKTMPELVIALEASDLFLCHRVMDLPQSEVEGTHYTEEEMLRRLSEYRTRNTDENTVLNFFDDNEVHPQIFNVEAINLEDVFEKLKVRLGPPRTYGMSMQERKQFEQDEAERRLREGDKLEQERMEEENRIRKEREANMEQWTAIFEKLRSEEEALLACQGAPLRHYLAKYVLPTLTKGLLEVARVRPTDPIDFLAEYLFRENPEGKMLDPAWTENGEDIMQNVNYVLSVPGERK